MDSNNGLTRIEKRKIEEEKKRLNKLREEELERKRQELKQTIFEENKSNFKVTPNKKENKSRFTRIIIALTILLSLGFLVYTVMDSVTKIDMLYQIINSVILFLIIFFFVIFYKTRKNVIQVFACILTIALIGFNVAVMTNILSLPKQEAVLDFVNTPLTKAMDWADENKIEYDQTFEHSDTVKKYSIISQDKKENTLLKNVKNINFVVSNGPDYNKEVIISDMTSWNIDEAVKIIKKNMLNNVTINFEENLDVDKDIITAQSKAGKIKRSEALIFTVSLGDKNNLQPINMQELKNKDLLDALLYLNRNGIIYELKYDFSDTIEKGKVISSSVKKGTTVKPDDKITLTISKGKEIIVPDLTKMDLTEVTKWMILNNLNIDYADEYSDSVKNGDIISATYKKGDIIEEDTTVRIVVSKGKLVMPKFNNLVSFKTWAETYKIKYEVKEEFNDKVAKGDIIKFSIETGKSIPKEGIIVYVSKGPAVTVPNFNGKNKDSIQKECDSLGIKCNFSNEYSTSVDNGKMISQSIKAGEKIAKGDTINIVIATNKKSEVTPKKNTSSNTNNKRPSNNSSSGSSHSTNTGSTPPTPTCKNYTFNLGAGATGAQTKQIIMGSNPNLKFSWNPVSACPSGDREPGTVCSSSVGDGASVSSCTIIRITYVN